MTLLVIVADHLSRRGVSVRERSEMSAVHESSAIQSAKAESISMRKRRERERAGGETERRGKERNDKQLGSIAQDEMFFFQFS